MKRSRIAAAAALVLLLGCAVPARANIFTAVWGAVSGLFGGHKGDNQLVKVERPATQAPVGQRNIALGDRGSVKQTTAIYNDPTVLKVALGVVSTVMLAVIGQLFLSLRGQAASHAVESAKKDAQVCALQGQLIGLITARDAADRERDNFIQYLLYLMIQKEGKS